MITPHQHRYIEATADMEAPKIHETRLNKYLMQSTSTPAILTRLKPQVIQCTICGLPRLPIKSNEKWAVQCLCDMPPRRS